MLVRAFVCVFVLVLDTCLCVRVCARLICACICVHVCKWPSIYLQYAKAAPAVASLLDQLVVLCGPALTHILLHGVAVSIPVVEASLEPCGRTWLALTQRIPPATWTPWWLQWLTAHGVADADTRVILTRAIACVKESEQKMGGWLRPWREFLALLSQVLRKAAPVESLLDPI